MSSSDQAVSEILSFILILGILSLGITVFTAAFLPGMEKSAEISHENQLIESTLSLKTGIDKLWVLGNPMMQSGTVFMPGSEKLREAGTVQIKEGAKLSFDHTYGNKTASLLFISVIPAYRTLNQKEYVLEGGAVFEDEKIFLPHSKSNNDAVLICFDGDDKLLSANCPVTIFYIYKCSEKFTSITNITLSDSVNQKYWRDELFEIENLTILNYDVWMEVVS